MGHYLAVIGALMVLYAGCTLLRDYLENRNIILKDNFRMEAGVAMLMKKAMTMDYNKLESAAGQKLLSAAKNAAGNPMAGGIDGMLRAVEPWLRGLLGILFYGGLAAALDWRILLVLAGMTVSGMILDTVVRRYEERTEAESKQNYREQDYLLSQSDNPANGKDVRLYRMESWFVDSLWAVFRRRWAWRPCTCGTRALWT